MKVVFAARAKADLKHIARYIALRNRQRAKSFVTELKSKALTIGDRPRAFAVLDRYANVAFDDGSWETISFSIASTKRP